VCLVGAFIMVAGESVLGESHTGIATVVGIVGIGPAWQIPRARSTGGKKEQVLNPQSLRSSDRLDGHWCILRNILKNNFLFL
jgi:hypothetical protein